MKKMARTCLKFLAPEEEDFVHDQSLKVLKDIGVLIRSGPVAKMLAESGADVDKKGIVKIPESMIDEALHKAPKEFTLHARNPKNDLRIPVDGAPFVSTDGLTVYMFDIDTGKKRTTTKKDLADFARLADALDGVDFFWPVVTAYDAPTESHNIHEMWTSLINCSKHLQHDSITADEARTEIKLASLITDGEKELKKRPIFSVVSCPIAPLSFEKGAVEAQVEFAKAGIPIVSMSMSLSGLSAPVTMAGTIINANSENLASLVISQFAAPGAPHIYSFESMPIDMQTGFMNHCSPEVASISAAGSQMAKRYGRPSMIGGVGVGGDKPGVMSSMLDVLPYTLTLMTGTDLVPGIGALETAKGSALEQVVIDSFFWEDVKGFVRNFKFDEKTAALDVMRQVGHGNSFLAHPHTAANMRKELFFFNKKRAGWWATLSDNMVPEAKEIAEKILREHSVEQVDRSVVKQGEEIIRQFEKGMIEKN
jgi:trimethylamine---corrinoid protein Co-methyltransferase